ncbi:hypothetical protein OC835_002557 [Tilletia horrida]|nr:hypothetical protein OC835_002557 [Tilletia horrida]
MSAQDFLTIPAGAGRNDAASSSTNTDSAFNLGSSVGQLAAEPGDAPSLSYSSLSGGSSLLGKGPGKSDSEEGFEDGTAAAALATEPEACLQQTSSTTSGNNNASNSSSSSSSGSSSGSGSGSAFAGLGLGLGPGLGASTSTTTSTGVADQLRDTIVGGKGDALYEGPDGPLPESTPGGFRGSRTDKGPGQGGVELVEGPDGPVPAPVNKSSRG